MSKRIVSFCPRAISAISFAMALCAVYMSSVGATGLSKSVTGGAKAIGMGGAFVGIADDATAIFHNPAGISQLKGYHLYFGVDALVTDLNYQPAWLANTTNKALTDLLPVPSFAVVASIPGPVTVGLGLFFPHGNGGSFDASSLQPTSPTDFPAPPYEGRIYSMELAPTAAWQVMEDLSIGASLRVIRISSGLKGQLVPLTATDFDVLTDLSVKGWALGAAAGILYRPIDKVSFGANYRSKVSTDLSGSATFSDGGFVDTNFGQAELTASIDQTLPTNIQAGFGFYPVEGLTLGLSYQFERNSEIRRFAGVLGGVQNINFPQNWNDTHTLHVGAEYWARPALAMRLGYAKDLNDAIPDAVMNRILGDIAAHEVSVGLVHPTQNFQFGLTWNARFGERTVPLDGLNNLGAGKYDAFVQSVSLGVNVTL